MTERQFSRRDFIGASALGALAGAAAMANPVRAAADAAGVKPSDLPDLTIREVKVYVADLGGPAFRRINSPESGEIVSIVTNSGIEGNYTLGNRVPGTGWLGDGCGVVQRDGVLRDVHERKLPVQPGRRRRLLRPLDRQHQLRRVRPCLQDPDRRSRHVLAGDVRRGEGRLGRELRRGHGQRRDERLLGGPWRPGRLPGADTDRRHDVHPRHPERRS